MLLRVGLITRDGELSTFVDTTLSERFQLFDGDSDTATYGSRVAGHCSCSPHASYQVQGGSLP